VDDAPADRVRVLHVIPGLGLGGAETVLFRLISAPSDIEHEVVCLGDRGWYSSPLEERGIRVYHLGNRFGALGAMFRLARIIRNSRANLIQCWMYRANLLGGFVGRVSGIPTIWNIRSSSFEPFGPWARLLVRLSGILARSIPAFVVNCSGESRQLHAKLGYGAAEGAVIYNGYDPAEFHPDDSDRKSRRKALGISTHTFLIGSISRWNAFKDIPSLLRGLRAAADRKIDMHCLLVGAGLDTTNGQLADTIRETGCEELVTMLGQQANIGHLARMIDLHVLASASEGFPNVVAETMLSGTPNIVTNVGDSALIVGETGWVTPPGDPDALGSAVGHAYGEWQNDTAQWRRRRVAARARIVEKFAIEQTRRTYEEIWRRFARKELPKRRPMSA
jgi:glycosyltransferase involved in cell wall biosynthesis